MPIKTAKQLIIPLPDEPPEIPDNPTEGDLRPWRERIDTIDVAVLNLLNERSRCANMIGSIKKSVGLPVYVPSRETAVIENVMTANRGPLPDTAVRRLFERIIDETRSLERHLYQEEESGGDDDAIDND
ncbi:MAG: chorismate mutase [Rhodothermia bacterium]|nr:chorismate mutase [Rhodothermia bacterium]